MIHRITIAVLLFSLASVVCHGQSNDSPPPPPPKPQIDTNNIFNRTSYGGWGDIPQGWKRQQRILRESSDSDLDSMARYATYPAERVFAFYSLTEKKSERCYSILLDRLTDKDLFWYFSVDTGWQETVGNFMLSSIWQYNGLYTTDQIHTIDSLAVFEPAWNIWTNIVQFYDMERKAYMTGSGNSISTANRKNWKSWRHIGNQKISL